MKWKKSGFHDLVTSRKRSLGQGNVFTGVCLSTGVVPVQGGSLCKEGLCPRGASVRGGLYPRRFLSREGVSIWGSLSGGLYPGGLYLGGLCLGVSVWGVSVWGVSVQGVSIQGVSIWGVSVWGVSVWGVSVQGVSLQEDSCMVKSGQYAPYWNVFLLFKATSAFLLMGLSQYLVTFFSLRQQIISFYLCQDLSFYL